LVTTRTGISAGIFSWEKVEGSNTALMRLIRVFIVARFSYIVTNLLPKNKHLIGRVLRADQGPIGPKIGKMRVFWEILTDYYGKNCEIAQKTVPDRGGDAVVR
jgi:hypothetical protein